MLIIVSINDQNINSRTSSGFAIVDFFIILGNNNKIKDLSKKSNENNIKVRKNYNEDVIFKNILLNYFAKHFNTIINKIELNFQVYKHKKVLSYLAWNVENSNGDGINKLFHKDFFIRPSANLLI